MEYIEALWKALNDTSIQTNIDKKLTLEDIKKIFQKIKKQANTIYFIGNGGSAAIAEHMTVDFLKNGNMRTANMFAPPTITCLSNDYGYEYVFSKQIEQCANEGDLLVAISSSGNSPNIVNAVKKAKEMKMEVLTLSGFKPNNQIKMIGDYNIYVPSMEYGMVETIHNMILQEIVDEIKNGEE